MSNILTNIQKLYNQFDKNKDMVSEVYIKPDESLYPNLKFAKRTRQDEINKALLDDLQKASQMTGLDITIDFAKTDHGKYAKSGNVSRHWSQNAVDIDYIGGKVVSPKNRDVVDKFVNALLSMGYNKNAEGSSHPKAVLTFGFAGHDNHVHVSNTTGSPSSVDPNYQPSSDDSTEDGTSDTTKAGAYGEKINIGGTKSKSKSAEEQNPLLYLVAKDIGSKVFNLKEGFGKNIQSNMGTIVIPGSSNPRVKSPIDGVVNNKRFVQGCKNEVTIESSTQPQFFLQYCGMTTKKVNNGDPVSQGQDIGTMDSKDNAEVLFLDKSYNRKNIDPQKFDSFVDKQKEKEPNKKVYIKGSNRQYSDPALAGLILLPKKIFGNVYDKDTGELKTKKWKDWDSKRDVDPWIANAFKKVFNKKK